MILTTERLAVREFCEDDLPAITATLREGEAIVAFPGAYGGDRPREWLQKQRARYRDWGHGKWAVTLKESGAMIGFAGPSRMAFEGRDVLEVGYSLMAAHRGMGYATEVARGCIGYCFDRLGADAVFSLIRDTNLASMNVAIRNGMLARGYVVKDVYGVAIPHILFGVRRP